MKKLFKMMTLCALTIFLIAGCAMKSEYGIVIGKDKDVKLEFIVAYDNEMLDGLMDMANSMSTDDDTSTEQKNHTDAERWEYLETNGSESDDFKDFDKKKYDQDGYKGYVYSTSVGKIDDLVAEGTDKIDIDKMDKDSKIFTKDGDVYKLNIKISDENSNQMSQYAETIKFDATIKVTLPVKAKTNNATSVDGNTYIWDLTKTKEIDLSFDFNGASSSSSTTMYIIIGVVAAVVIIGGIAFVCLKKKNTQKVGE